MNAPSYEHVKRVLNEVAELPVGEREARLRELCGDDAALAAEVRALLAHVDAPDARVAPVPGARDAIAAQLSNAGEDDEDIEVTHRIDGRLETGARVGPFVLGERIGAGGMGVVFAAEQDTPRRAVALKFLAEGLASREARQRFRREVHALGRLEHPGIATIHEAGAVETPVGVQPFFAMQLVRGVSLSRWLEDDQPNDDAILDVALQVCDAVAHAHDAGIVHRDLKPSNVLIEDDRAVVVDFGIAKTTDAQTQLTSLATSSGQILGTIRSMSPEQVGGDATLVDARTDVYALGVMLFEALTGRSPLDLEGLSVPAAALVIRDRDPRRLSEERADLPQELSWIVDKALAKEPERRYADARALGDDLRRLVARERVVAKPLTSGQQLLRLARKHRVVTGAIVVTFVALVVALAVSLHQVELAEESQELMRIEAARARLAAAAAACEDGEPTSARRQLDAIPADLRGWEWHHFAARLAPFDVLATETGGILDVVFDGQTAVATTADAIVRVALPSGEASRSATPAPRRALADDAPRAVSVHDGMISLIDTTTGAVIASRACDDPTWVAIDAAGTAVGWASNTAMHRWDVATDTVATHTDKEVWVRGTGHVTSDGLLIAKRYKSVGRFVVEGDSLVSAAEVRVSEQRPGDIAIGSSIGVATREGRLVLLDPTSLEQLASLAGHRGAVTSVAVNAAGTRFVTAGVDGTLRLWDAVERRHLGTWSTGEHVLRRLALSADGLTAVGATRNTLISIDLAQPPESDVLTGHRSYVYDVAALDDGTIASISWDKTVRRWDLARAATVEVVPLQRRGDVISASPGKTRLAVRCANSVGVLGRGGVPIDVTKTSSRLRTLAWLDDRQVLVAERRDEGSEPGFTAFDVESGEPTDSWELSARVVCVDVLGRLAVAATVEDEVFVVDLDTRHARRVGSHAERITSVTWSPDGAFVLSTSEDGQARLWSAEDGRLLHDIPHGQEVWCGVWLPDGSRFATGCHDGAVRVFEPADGVLVATLRGHENYVYALDVTPSGETIVSASGDSTLRVWRAPGVNPPGDRDR